MVYNRQAALNTFKICGKNEYLSSKMLLYVCNNCCFVKHYVNKNCRLRAIIALCQKENMITKL